MKRSIQKLPFLLRCWLLAYTALVSPHWVEAQTQSQRLPLVDITTDALSWAEQTGSIYAQLNAYPWLGISAGFAYRPQQSGSGRFLSESQSFELMGEARLFPFGPARDLLQKDTRPAYWKKRKEGCKARWCAAPPRSGLKKVFAGIFVAPGYSYHQQDAVYFPTAEVHSPIPEFRYRVKNQGPLATLGYQLRLRRVTLAASTGLKFSLPKWEGPVQVFSEDIYSITFPQKLRVEHFIRVEAGFNF